MLKPVYFKFCITCEILERSYKLGKWGDNAFIVGFTLSYIFCIVHSWKPRIRDSFGLLEVGKSLYFIFLCAVLFPSHMPLSRALNSVSIKLYQTIKYEGTKCRADSLIGLNLQATADKNGNDMTHLWSLLECTYILLKTQELYLVERKTKKYSLVFYLLLECLMLSLKHWNKLTKYWC